MTPHKTRCRRNQLTNQVFPDNHRSRHCSLNFAALNCYRNLNILAVPSIRFQYRCFRECGRRDMITEHVLLAVAVVDQQQCVGIDRIARIAIFVGEIITCSGVKTATVAWVIRIHRHEQLRRDLISGRPKLARYSK